MKVFGGCMNMILCNALHSFLGVFLVTLERTGYVLNDLEVILAMKVLREFIYFGQSPDEKIFSTLLKIGGAEKVVRQWIRFI
jgi:hypothetical protein